jgi:hypothetical protein
MSPAYQDELRKAVTRAVLEHHADVTKTEGMQVSQPGVLVDRVLKQVVDLPDEIAARTVQAWEYRHRIAAHKDVIELCREQGLLGWELCGTYPSSQPPGVVTQFVMLVFKQKKDGTKT